MNAKSIAGWLVLALVIWWAIENPHSASDLPAHIGHFVSTSASGITHFFGNI